VMRAAFRLLKKEGMAKLVAHRRALYRTSAFNGPSGGNSSGSFEA